jgi:hypothetical protein
MIVTWQSSGDNAPGPDLCESPIITQLMGAETAK